MISVVLPGGLKNDGRGWNLREYTFWYMVSVILPGGMTKVRDEHGMLRGYPFWYRISVTHPSGVQNEGRAWDA